MKKIFKTLIDTIKDPNLLSSRPHHGEQQHQGWENDDKCCPNCGNTIQCICDLQGLSDLEKDSIGMDGGASLELDLAFITISEDFGKMITIMEDEWMIVENKNATHYWFPEDITTKIVTHKIGKFLVTIQELKQ